MRALILSWEYPPIVEGGLARHVRKLSEQLVAQDVEVHVLSRGDESMPAEEDLEGVVVHRVREPRRPRDLATWSAPAVAELAWSARAAELRVLTAGAEAGPRALRELLALQASDWAFMVTRGLAGDYPRRRARDHAQALDAALGIGSAGPALRHLAPSLHVAGLPED